MKRLLFAALLVACSSAEEPESIQNSGAERLSARPGAATTSIAPGTYGLLVATPKDASLFIPNAVAGMQQVPLVVFLHGGGGTPSSIDTVYALAERIGFAVLVPRSRGSTWDLARGGFGEDVPVINKALEETFKKLRVDPARIALAGFSDGASYALSLGMGNADLFTHIIAFSPGFIRPVTPRGKSPFFIMHGTADGVLPFETTAQNIVPYLRNRGYDVRFEEFQGGHRIDPAEAQVAFSWFTS